jgi:hypothetical protein
MAVAVEKVNRDVVSFSPTDCPIESVIVYQDRAEITRKLIYHPLATGEIEIILPSITLLSVSLSFGEKI